ncbi:hypothetical protein IAU60_000171 [Kwoniella sp. DSM 27419]
MTTTAPSPRGPFITRTTSHVSAFDVIGVLDPASVGGGGPLKRIETARSERHAQESRDRARRELEAVDAPDKPDQGGNALFKRFRSHSMTSRKRPMFGATLLDTHPSHEEEDHAIEPAGSPDRHRLDYTDHLDPSNDPACAYNEKTLDEKPADVDAELQPVEIQHEYPDGGYGWVVLLCCVTLAGCTLGYNMNYGVFQEHYANVVFPNEKTSVLSLGGSVCAFGMNFSAFLSGRIGDRYGFKRVLFASTFVSWLGIFLASWSTKIWQLILTQGVISGFGFGLAMPLFMSLPSQWFYRRRGLASGIAIGGAGIGGGTVTLLTRQLITAVGYKKTLLILSFLELFFMGLATIFIRTRPTAPEAQRRVGSNPLIDKTVVRTSSFWSLAGSILLGTIGYGMPYMLLTQYVRATLPNLDSILIAVPPTIMGYMVAVGRALVGFVADLIGPLNTYILVFVFSGIIQLALWYTARTFAAVMVFAVMFGLVAPGYSGLLPQISVQLFGPANLATNVGLILLCSSPGAFITGPLGGALYDLTGRTTFKYAIAFSGTMQVLGGIGACWARYRTSRKVLAKV